MKKTLEKQPYTHNQMITLKYELVSNLVLKT